LPFIIDFLNRKDAIFFVKKIVILQLQTIFYF